MNITMLNTTFPTNYNTRITEDLMTVNNCLEYTEGLRKQIKAIEFFILALIILFVVYIYVSERNKKKAVKAFS